MTFTFKELEDALEPIVDELTYVAIADDGRVVVMLGAVDEDEPLPETLVLELSRIKEKYDA